MSAQDPVVIYLHGFNSSPQSHKARILQQWVAERNLPVRIEVPALPYAPADAARVLTGLVDHLGSGRQIGIIGSSLGGYYATWLADRYKVPAALVNPAVRPYELLTDYLGENQNLYTGERYCLTEQHMQELLDLDVPEPEHPELFFLLVQTADETLDCRQATEKFSRSKAWIEGGGTHEFTDFEHTLPAIFRFFGWPLSLADN